MHSIHLCGNIGAEPDFIVFPNGKKKVGFSVAINQFGKDGKQKDAIWVPCQGWDTVYERLFKCRQKGALRGRKINLTGTFTQSEWKDQATGKIRTKLIVRIQSFELLGGYQEEAAQSDGEPAAQTELKVAEPAPESEPAATAESNGRTTVSA